MAEEESVCDWSPPPDVVIVESEVFQIPSGLPSLDEFVRNEIRKEEEEAAAAAAMLKAELEEAAEEDVDTHVAEVEAGDAEVASVQDEPAGAEAEPGVEAAPEEVASVDDFAMPEPEVKKPKKQVKRARDDWDEMDTGKVDFGEVQNLAEQQANAQARLRIIESTHDYIDKLITKVVEHCEYEDPDDILRGKLDKAKVRKELDEKLLQLDVEQKVRLFLNRKTVEYFRRKKAIRPLMDDAPETVLTELRKYRDNLMLLNKYKGMEVAIETSLQTRLAELKEKLGELEDKAEDLGKQFHNMVRKVFGEGASEKMDTLIESLMNKVKNTRKEISKTRTVLIQRQHTLASLLDKAKKLEDLGNGLRMMNFEHLQTETQALGKKIEERNNELNRLHSRFNSDIHTLAHVREKQHMIRNTIAAQQETYDVLVEEKKDFRAYLNNLKIERGSIRREFQRISFQGGLLDKPDLLLDYDNTVEKTEALRAKITEMKASQLVIDNRLKHMTRLLQ